MSKVLPDSGSADPARPSPADSGFQGRRQHQRIECRLPAAFTLGSDGTCGQALVVNIGLGGARVDLPLEVGLVEEIDLEITGPAGLVGDAAATMMRMSGRVMWTTSEPVAGLYPTGLQFLRLDDATRRRLYDLLASLAG